MFCGANLALSLYSSTKHLVSCAVCMFDNRVAKHLCGLTYLFIIYIYRLVENNPGHRLLAPGLG